MKRNQICIAFLALISALTACNSYRHAGTCMNNATDYPHCTQLPLQEYVPEPDYLPLSPELQAFYELNAIRRKLGLGLLAQHAQLDNAARNHLRYIIRNLPADTNAYGHAELPGKPEFTGIGPTERAQFAGYPGTAGENLGGANAAFHLSPAFNFLNTISHARLMLDQCATNIGIGYAAINDRGNQLDPLVLNFGNLFNAAGHTICQKNSERFYFHYPYDGQINVPLSMTPEDPNPVPDLPKDTAGHDDWMRGTSAVVIFGFERSATIEQIESSVTEMKNGQALPVRLFWWKSSQYPNPHRDKHIAYLVGYQPFKPKSSYKVMVNAVVSGAQIKKEFSFSTR